MTDHDILTHVRELVCPYNRDYRLVLDPREVFPDDPGQGTPAMVYGPRGSSGTYNCVLNEGEIGTERWDCFIEVVGNVHKWLDDMFEEVSEWEDDVLRAMEHRRTA